MATPAKGREARAEPGDSANGARARPRPPGLVDSLRAMGDGVLAAAQDRLELLALEIEEEKLRLVRMLLWACVAAFAGMMALVFLSLVLVGLYWNTARLQVLVGLALAYAGLFAGAWIGARRWMVRAERPFAATREEIARDRESLRPEA